MEEEKPIRRLLGGPMGNGKGGGGKGGGGGGKGGNDSAEKFRIRAEKAEAKLRQIEADEANNNADEATEEDEMEDGPDSKEECDRIIEAAEGDRQHALAQSKKYPKEPKYLAEIEEAEGRIEAARQKINELRSPSDQLRYKLGREKKLKAKLLKLEAGLKEDALIIAEAQDRMEDKREQFHEAQDELQLIESQKSLLCAAPTALPQPMDVAQCVEGMRQGLGAMFDDARLSDDDKAKRAEMEAGFVAMQNIFATLSTMRQRYDAACLAAAATTSTTSGADENPPAGSAASGGGTAAATTQSAVEAEEPAVVAKAPAPVPAARPVPDGPAKDRAADRERTPPPGGRAKEIEKMAITDLVGPRKAKGGTAAKAKPKAAA